MPNKLLLPQEACYKIIMFHVNKISMAWISLLVCDAVIPSSTRHPFPPQEQRRRLSNKINQRHTVALFQETFSAWQGQRVLFIRIYKPRSHSIERNLSSNKPMNTPSVHEVLGVRSDCPRVSCLIFRTAKRILIKFNIEGLKLMLRMEFSSG
jgi:hypothetical protein